MSARAPVRIAAALPWLFLLALAAAVSFQQVRAFDYWWHLRTGQLILETGTVPRVDPYTFTVEGSRWIDIHWLHQIGLYLVHRVGGSAGVVLAKGAAVLALLCLLVPIGARRHRPLVSIIALGLMLLVVADRIMPRPELPSFLCLAGVLLLLDRFTRKPDARIYGVVAIQLLWANVHGLFALGIAVCGIYLAAEILRPIMLPGASLRWANVRRLGVVVLLSALVSLANPNGLEGALYPIQQLSMIGPPDDRGHFGSIIAELIPPFAIPGEGGGTGQLLFGLIGAYAFVAMALNWRRLHAADPLLLVAFLYLALGARRNLALFAIVAVPVAVRNLNAWLDARVAAGAEPMRPAIRTVAGVLVCVALGVATVDVVNGTFYTRVKSTRAFGLGTMDLFYPVAATDWIEWHRPRGPLCHHMADGGYLIWRLHPDYKVMIDGRLEVFGEEKFASLQFSDPSQFRRVDAEYGCGAVLLHYSLVESEALLRWFHLNSNWQLVFVDDVAALYVRLPEDGRALYAEVDLEAPDLFAPLDDERGVSDRMRRLARTNFLTTMRRYEPALALWRETLERYPDMPQGPIVHATLLHHNGLVAAAEAVLRQLIEEDPTDAVRHTQIADLRLEAGDLEAGRELYDRALELDPHLPYALFRRAEIAQRDGDVELATRLFVQVLARTRPRDRLAVAAAAKLGGRAPSR